MGKRLLLLAGGDMNSYTSEMQDFLKSIKKIVVLPQAVNDMKSHGEQIKRWMEVKLGLVAEVVYGKDEVEKILSAKAIFVSGGNTFLLLKRLQEANLLEIVKKRVLEGALYLGTSAGSNVACPTIKTTNDMPVVSLSSLDALNLIPLQINPHYFDPLPTDENRGETREKRLQEYHQHNEYPVIGLREGSMLRVEGDIFTLKGSANARMFKKGEEPTEHKPNEVLNL